MKRFILFTLVGLFAALTAQAQIKDYRFSMEQGAYWELKRYNPADYDSLQVNDDLLLPEKFKLPFAFRFGNRMIDSIGIAENGYLWIGNAVTGTGVIGNDFPLSTSHDTEKVKGIIAPLAADLHPRFQSNTKIYVGSFGTAPFRTFVVEWYNTTRVDAFMDTREDSLTFQVRLYETSNRIEFMYSHMEIAPNTFSVVEVGIKSTHDDFNIRSMDLLKNWDSTHAATAVDNSVMELSPTKHPQFGYIFAFTPTFSAGQKDWKKEVLSLQGNPVKETLTWKSISEEQQEVTIYHVNGQKVYTAKAPRSSIDVSALAPGTYLLEVKSAHSLARARFVKL